MTTVKLVKIRRGLYRIDGVTHTHGPRPACGGQIFAERFAGRWDYEYHDGKKIKYRIHASWECYCEKCKVCDPNGWATLAECLVEAPAFWMGEEAKSECEVPY